MQVEELGQELNQAYFYKDKDVVWRNIAGQVVIADRINGNICMLNETGSMIWQLIDGTKKLNNVAREIRQKFELSDEDAERDTFEFYSQLFNAGLIHPATSPNS